MTQTDNVRGKVAGVGAGACGGIEEREEQKEKEKLKRKETWEIYFMLLQIKTLIIKPITKNMLFVFISTLQMQELERERLIYNISQS